MMLLENLTKLEFEARLVASTPSVLRELLDRSPEVVELGAAYDARGITDGDIRTFIDGLMEEKGLPHQRALSALAVMFEGRSGSMAEEYLLDLSRANTARMRWPSMVARECLLRRKNWSDDKSRRRGQLIDKEIDGVLSRDEEAELERLQEEMLAYRRLVAPLPLDGLRKIYQELLQKAEESECGICVCGACEVWGQFSQCPSL